MSNTFSLGTKLLRVSDKLNNKQETAPVKFLFLWPLSPAARRRVEASPPPFPTLPPPNLREEVAEVAAASRGMQWWREGVTVLAGLPGVSGQRGAVSSCRLA